MHNVWRLKHLKCVTKKQQQKMSDNCKKTLNVNFILHERHNCLCNVPKKNNETNFMVVLSTIYIQ